MKHGFNLRILAKMSRDILLKKCVTKNWQGDYVHRDAINKTLLEHRYTRNGF